MKEVSTTVLSTELGDSRVTPVGLHKRREMLPVTPGGRDTETGKGRDWLSGHAVPTLPNA